MKFDMVRKILVAVGIAILLVGTIGVFWTKVVSSPVWVVRNVEAAPETSLFVPKQAPLMVSLLADAKQLQAYGLDQLPPEARRDARANFSQLRQRMKTQIGIDYEADIFPWVGSELSFALTTRDVDRDASNGEEWGYLLAIAVGDTERSQSALQSIWQTQTSRWGDLTIEDYSGVKLVYPDITPAAREDDPNTPVIATAQVSDAYVLFSNDAGVLRNAVSNVQVSSLNLGSSEVYQRAIATLPDERVGMLWVNANALQPQLRSSQPGSEEDLGAGAISNSGSIKLNNISGWLSSIAISPAGLVADTVVLPPDGQPWTTREPRLNQPLQVLRQVPADSALMIAGSDLPALWKRWLAAAKAGDRTAQQLIQPFQVQDEVWGFSFADQVIPWSTGEFALAQMHSAAIPETSAPEKANPEPDWLFVTDSSEEASEGIQHLDAIATDKGLTVGTLPIQDQAAQLWSQLRIELTPDNPAAPVSLRTDVKGIHTVVEDHELLATSVNTLGKALFPNRYSVAESNSMQQAFASLEESNDGYVLIDWDLAKPRLAEAFPTLGLLIEWSDPLLDSVRSLLMSTYGQDPEGLHVGTVIQFPTDESK
ncbi:MAG: DUF3352 domain-containing protein [Elainellaceae cyanobacterium]